MQIIIIISGGLAVAYGTEASMGFAASIALGTTPVGWSIAAGIGVGMLVDYAYDKNFFRNQRYS